MMSNSPQRSDTDEAVLVTSHLARRYGELTAVHDFTSRVARSQTVVLVGPNGCGKTTSVEMSIGLRRPDSGQSIIDGIDVQRPDRHLAAVLGVALQGASLNLKVRVREHLELAHAMYAQDGNPFEIAETLGLDSKVRSLYYGQLSGGQQRRTLVAVALAGRPSLAVLDEPTSGVDVESRLQMWAGLREIQRTNGAGYLITTHDLSEAEAQGDYVLIMRSGRIVAKGSPSELVAASGLATVLILRSSRQRLLTDNVLPSHDGVVLVASDAEIRLGFQSAAGGLSLHEWARAQGVSVIERSPTLEDAYLGSVGASLATNGDEEAV